MIKLLLLALCVSVFFGGGLVADACPRKVVILLGAPGSGKGTQAKKLQAIFNLPHISTGDLFRFNIKEGTPLGKKAQEYTNAGKLVPDEIVLDMLFDRISKDDAKQGYILDGFPRTIPQAEALQKRLEDKDLVIALNLDVSDDTVVKRISGRRTCSVSGEVYNIYFAPPPKERACKEGELIQRPDDRPEVVQERLKVYHNQTEPLIQFYDRLGVLVNVDGEKDPGAILTELTRVINEKIESVR